MNATRIREIKLRSEIERRQRAARISSAARMPGSGATPLVGTGELVVLGLSTAKTLCRKWRKLAKQMHYHEKEALARGMPGTAGVLLGTAQGLDTCIRDIRRLVERAKNRQPQHNNPVRHDGAQPRSCL